MKVIVTAREIKICIEVWDDRGDTVLEATYYFEKSLVANYHIDHVAPLEHARALCHYLIDTDKIPSEGVVNKILLDGSAC